MKNNNNNTKANELSTKQPLFIDSVSSSLFSLSNSKKYDYLFKKVYENVTTTRNGRLMISTYWCRKTAELLGGDYDRLSKFGKSMLKDSIVEESIIVENGFSKYADF